MKKHNVKGATDVTGFGLAGHALKMAKASAVSIKLKMKQAPLIEQTYSLVNEGCIPGASFRNLEYAENNTLFAADLDYNLKMIAFDAQTSGGLLISAPAGKADDIINDLHKTGLASAAIVGEAIALQQHPLIIEN